MFLSKPQGALQDIKLPLHYAAAKGAPFGVLKVLLDANPKAVTAADKARCRVHTAARARVVSPLPFSPRPRSVAPAEAAPGTALRRTAGCRFITPQRTARRWRW